MFLFVCGGVEDGRGTRGVRRLAALKNLRRGKQLGVGFLACGIVALIPSGKRPGSLAAGLNGEIAVFHPAMLPVVVSHHSMGF